MIRLYDKNILITGGTGLVGRALLNELITLDNYNTITVISLDYPTDWIPNKRISWIKDDLTNPSLDCLLAEDIDIIFHIAGFRGSPVMTTTRQYEFFYKNLQCNTHVLHAMLNHPTMQWGVYTSSLGVYGPSTIFKEEEMWNHNPSQNDWYAGWAKRMGEVQIDAFEEQYHKRNISIIKPATIYGPYDNFDLNTSMVVAALIRKAVEASYKKEPLSVWGDGSPIRDFIHATDVARAMIFLVENKITRPVNIGSGTGITIRELAETIVWELPRNFYKPQIVWDISKPMGDKKRILDISRINKYGFKNFISLKDGIRNTIQWYIDNVK